MIFLSREAVAAYQRAVRNGTADGDMIRVQIGKEKRMATKKMPPMPPGKGGKK